MSTLRSGASSLISSSLGAGVDWLEMAAQRWRPRRKQQHVQRERMPGGRIECLTGAAASRRGSLRERSQGFAAGGCGRHQSRSAKASCTHGIPVSAWSRAGGPPSARRKTSPSSTTQACDAIASMQPHPDVGPCGRGLRFSCKCDAAEDLWRTSDRNGGDGARRTLVVELVSCMARGYT